MTHMTHQDGGDQQRRLRVGEEVEEPVQVELFTDLGVAVVPRHEVDQGEATHQGNPLELSTRFFLRFYFPNVALISMFAYRWSS